MTNMRYLFTLFVIVQFIVPTYGQNEILNSDFSIPDKVQYKKLIFIDIESLDIDSDGIGFYWDLSPLPIEQREDYIQFQKFPDTNAEYANNSFLAITRENAVVNSSFEIYSMTKENLFLRGYGILDKQGTSTYDTLDLPFKVMKFPWTLGDSILYDNPPILSKRTYSAKGFIKLPGQEVKQVWKIKEEFTENDILVLQYFWYSTELPYPILTITKHLQVSDSSILFTSAEALINRTMSSLSEGNQSKQEDITLVDRNRVLLSKGLSLLKIFSIDGSEIAYSIENSGEYLLESTIPNVLFFVLKDSKNNISTQTIISKQ
jgi:hypothetical protein